MLYETAFAQQPNAGIFNQPVMPGPEGVYIYAWDSTQSNLTLSPDKKFIISKDEKGNGKFEKIARVQFPESPTELNNRFDPALLNSILKNRKLKSVGDLYTQLSMGHLDTLGFYLLNAKVLSALGMMYFDNSKNKNRNTTYKVEVEENSNRRFLYQRKLNEVTYTPFPLFKKYSVSASDSSVSCTWYATKGTGNFAKIFVNEEKYSHSIKQYIYSVKDTMFVSYTMKAISGRHYTLYIRAMDMAGNMGMSSDTAHLLAFSNEQIGFIQNVKLTDSLGGMYLSWDPLSDSKRYSGIEILKSRSATEEFSVSDTISASVSSWLDKNVIGGTVYYYKIKPLLYNLPNSVAGTPVLVNGIKNLIPKKMRAAQALQLTFTQNRNIRLVWLPDDNVNLFAYYILRGTSPHNLEVISPPVRDTVYIDSLKNLNPGNTYLYAIAARDMKMNWSDTSALVSMVMPVNRIVTAPSGLAARYTERGVHLFWNDVTLSDPSVIGYIIYKRKKGTKNFTPLIYRPIQGSTFLDSLIEEPGLYEYGCAAMDARGDQSILSILAHVEIPGKSFLYPPANFTLRNTSRGIVISIPQPIDAPSNRSFVIYRRKINEKLFKKIGEVPTQQALFVDSSVKEGEQYIYAPAIRQGEFESRKGSEKLIRRR